MRVFSVFIFLCFLQTAKQSVSNPSQQKQPVIKPNRPQPTIKPDFSVKQLPGLKENPERDLDQNPNPDLKENPERDLDQNPNPDLKENPERDLDQNPNPDLKENPERDLDQNPNPDLKENPERDLDQNPNPDLKENPERDLDQNPNPDLKENPERDLDQNPNPDLKENPERDLDQNPNPDLKENPERDLDQNPNPNLDQQPTEKPKEGQSKQNKKNHDSTNPAGPKQSTDDGSWGPAQCEQQKYTRMSCTKVFCPPWRRCIAGQCVCQMPYKCPRQNNHACTLDGSEFYSMCQTNAIACRSNKATFSHFSQHKPCKVENKVHVVTRDSNSKKVVEIHIGKESMLVCGNEWNMAAANVVCRSAEGVDRGAEKASKIPYGDLDKTSTWPKQCLKVRCTGSELSLAECTIFKPMDITKNPDVAVANCYKEPEGGCTKFTCVNGKCLNYGKLCDGVDDCGDNSDEMCCLKCRGNKKDNPFHCPSGVCIPHYAVRDGVRDCLGGEDELEVHPNNTAEHDPDHFITDPLPEIKRIRSSAEEKLMCGVPNMQYVYKAEDDGSSRLRTKRLVGGEEALPTQIQWQVAIQDEGSIHCGGVYLGGCWVLTAAHCVRPKPKSFHVKFSLWKKHRRQSTTDIIPVKKIIIHQEYDPQTYANDIALVQLEELNLSDKCMHDNPAVRAVCVPWSTQLFQPNDNCTISGWGRDKAGKSASILKWANVTIIGNCQEYYKDRFLPGMECAGDLDGKVDSCQGDSGGPLVCEDASGLSYVWGIVSWGDKCGEPNNPGVYTKVAHYFDWIRFSTGWPAVTKFNQ